MLMVDGPFADPLLQKALLLITQSLIRIGRRHALVRIVRQNAAEHLTIVRVPPGEESHHCRSHPGVHPSVDRPHGCCRPVRDTDRKHLAASSGRMSRLKSIGSAAETVTLPANNARPQRTPWTR